MNSPLAIWRVDSAIPAEIGKNHVYGDMLCFQVVAVMSHMFVTGVASIGQ